MSKIQNPFSVYDFLGYLTPGIFITSGLSIIKKFDTIIDKGFFAWIGSIEKNVSFESCLSLIVLFYIIGHIVNYLSAIIIERHSVLVFDYPSKYLIKKGNPRDYSIKEKGGSLCDLLFRSLVYIVTSPLFIFKILLKSKISRPMDEIYIKPYINKANQLSKRLLDKDEIEDFTDSWRLIYHHMSEIAPYHFTKFQNYVALYGFTRAICFCFLIFSWYSLVKLVFFRGSVWLVLLSFMGLFVMYMAFNKFYRRFSLEVIMSYLSFEKQT